MTRRLRVPGRCRGRSRQLDLRSPESLGLLPDRECLVRLSPWDTSVRGFKPEGTEIARCWLTIGGPIRSGQRRAESVSASGAQQIVQPRSNVNVPGGQKQLS